MVWLICRGDPALRWYAGLRGGTLVDFGTLKLSSKPCKCQAIQTSIHTGKTVSLDSLKRQSNLL